MLIWKAKLRNCGQHFRQISESLKAVEGRLREIQPLIKNLDNYRKLKPIWDEYSNARHKPVFREKHRAELMIFESARKALREHYGERKWNSLKELQAERGRLTAEQDRLYAERERIKKQFKEVETVKGTVDKILGNKAQEQVRLERKDTLN